MNSVIFITYNRMFQIKNPYALLHEANKGLYDWIAWQRPTLTGTKSQLPLALKSLTSVFGMGTGVTSSLSPPDLYLNNLLVAGTGFEPATFGLWARRATELLHPAMIKKAK